MPPYQYKPLHDASIRILELLPGESDDPLKGCIGHRVFIPEWRKHRRWVPIYEALSYAWGEQDDLKILTVVDDSTGHETVLQIGKNLALALRDLRNTSKSRTIWCDAVCINQKDLPERAAQVQRMADIYRHADRVVVWLSPENERFAHALHLLDEFGSHVYYDIGCCRFYTHEGMNKTYLSKGYLVQLSSSDWQCVGDLLSLPWFKRLWVRQEITLANDSALLTSGRHQLRWPRFCSAVAYLDSKLKWDATVVKATQKPGLTAAFLNAMDITHCKIWMQKSVNIVISVDRCQCADPRDKIYGVLGLQTDFSIPIDYTKTAKEVYTDWALGYYKHYSTLEFLQLCEMAGSPSWVPDISKPMNLRLTQQAKARSGLRTKATFDILPGQTSRMLAIHCGTITELTTAMPNKPDPEVIREKFKSWIRQLFPRGVQSPDYLKIYELATTVSGGRAVEKYEKSRFNTMNVRDALLRDSKGPIPPITRRGPLDPKLSRELGKLLPSAAVLATKDGHFGLGSGAAQIGDEIFVLLGCHYPIIMRSVGDLKYMVVAPCYFPHLSHGEAILGHFPDGWNVKFDIRRNLIFVAPDGSRTLEDPRLERELPSGWEQKESRDHSHLLWKRTEDKTWLALDPRQTPEKLEARGVKLEMITVV